MDRSDFGAFGAGLTDGEFAQAVLAPEDPHDLELLADLGLVLLLFHLGLEFSLERAELIEGPSRRVEVLVEAEPYFKFFPMPQKPDISLAKGAAR